MTNFLLLLILITLLAGSSAVIAGLQFAFMIGVFLLFVIIFVYFIYKIPSFIANVARALFDFAADIFAAITKTPKAIKWLATLWISAFVAPVMLPLSDARQMNLERARGVEIHPIVAASKLLFVTVMGLLLWIIIIPASVVFLALLFLWGRDLISSAF